MVAAYITDRLNCIELALELGVAGQVLAVVEGKTDAQYTSKDCHNLLLGWWDTQPEDGPVALYQGLIAVGKAAIADYVHDKLFAEGETE